MTDLMPDKKSDTVNLTKNTKIMAKKVAPLHHGRILKKLVSNDSRTNEEIAERMGITRSPLQKWMTKAVLTPDQLAHCKKAGYDIELMATPSKLTVDERKGREVNALQKKVERLELELEDLKAKTASDIKDLFKEIYRTQGMIEVRPK